MDALAVILEAPRSIALRKLMLHGSASDASDRLAPSDVVVSVRWSGISTGTEKLLWSGEMPPFPGMGYPLVPGYESVGTIVDAGREAQGRIGDWVFVPGAACYRDARALFGGTAQTVIVPSARAFPVGETLGASATLFALAATALHALNGGPAPELIIGHGALGRLLARLAIARGAPPPTVWERHPQRRTGAQGYPVIAPKDDDRHDYATIYDASGNADCLDMLIPRLRHGGEVVMAGFYANRPSFAFAPAFMREARFRIAAEWKPDDLVETRALVAAGTLSLGGVISHCRPASQAARAYPETFLAADCLKTVLDWSDCA
jgi:3-hydroxyethyl bacteriochlorophyllide a dehydrogenase